MTKSGIATSLFEILLTLTLPKFNEVTNVITCGGLGILLVVRPDTWQSCVQAESDTTHATNIEPAQEGRTKKVPSGPGEWTEVVRIEAKATTPSPQKEIPEKLCCETATEASIMTRDEKAAAAEEWVGSAAVIEAAAAGTRQASTEGGTTQAAAALTEDGASAGEDGRAHSVSPL